MHVKVGYFEKVLIIRHNKCKARILIGQLAIGERQQKASMVKLRQIAKISSLVR